MDTSFLIMENIMILSAKTINILKNFSTINPSILIKEGSVLRTISPGKTVMGKASVPDTFPNTFAIYNLSQLVNSISMIENPRLIFSDNCVKISDDNRSVVYYYSDASLITIPPEKDIKLPSVEAEFRLTNKDVGYVNKALGVLGLPEIAVVGDGERMTLEAVDTKNQSSNQFTIDIGKTDKVFKAIFKAENLKMVTDDYEVQISSKGISHFKGNEAEYWIAVESTSQF